MNFILYLNVQLYNNSDKNIYLNIVKPTHPNRVALYNLFTSNDIFFQIDYVNT